MPPTDYASVKNLDIAKTDLDFMIDQVDETIKNGGFGNDDVVWMIKAWCKINLLCGLGADSWGYWLFKRVPPKLAGKQKRSQILVDALDHYNHVLGPGSETGDFYRRADDAFLNFVWDYHLHIEDDVDKNTDFEHKVRKIQSAGRDGLLSEEVFPMDRGA